MQEQSKKTSKKIKKICEVAERDKTSESSSHLIKE
jgi:hypothetical protein